MMKKIERFVSFLAYKIDLDSQNFAIFVDFYSTDQMNLKLINGVVFGFGPKVLNLVECATVRVR